MTEQSPPAQTPSNRSEQQEIRSSPIPRESQTQKQDTTPPSQPPRPTETTAEHLPKADADPQSAQGERRQKRGPNWPEWIVAIATIGVFAATGVNVFVALKQWDAMQDGLKLTRESNELAQRSWVLVSGFRNIPAFQAGTPIKIQLILRNTGRTPAVNVVTTCRTNLVNTPIPSEFPY